MQTEVLTIYKTEDMVAEAEATLSFRPFVNYLKERMGSENGVKSQFYRYALDQFEKTGSRLIGDNESMRYRELMEMVYLILTPPATSEQEDFWAISSPLTGTIIYSTDSFYKFLLEQKAMQTFRFKGEKGFARQQAISIYRSILERFYKIPAVAGNEMVYTSHDAATGLSKFYRINADDRFIDITLKGRLPELSYAELETFLQEEEGLEQLEKTLPLSLFRFEGFLVVSLTDITIPQALESIRESLVNHSLENGQCGSQVMQSLKILAGDPRIEFGLQPFVDVNGKLVFVQEECSQSMVMNCAREFDMPQEAFDALVQEYRDHPKTLVFNNLSEEKQLQHPFLKDLKKAGIHSYAIIPAYYHKQLTGILEVYSFSPLLFDEKLLSRFHTAVPLIAQLLKYTADEFHTELKEVIQEKFTFLQPAVQWKFNETAWKYLQQKHAGTTAEIDTIIFRDLYPLYGEVDVRNSTNERNQAVQDDLKKQLSLLETTLESVVDLPPAAELLAGCKQWAGVIDQYFATKDELALNHFLERDVLPFLRQVKKNQGANPVIDEYLAAVEQGSGEAFAHRRELETSLQLINHELNRYFTAAQKKLHSTYPVYFEKFRTDGVEYDIYTGQSIAPGKPFDLSVVQQLRKWQLRSMAEIAGLMQALLPRMPRPLQTTQLIFVHPDQIDISFRNDERRFDVEGAYNIRYEVIKKRIDKVRVLHTRERLTQPGKIALVYFNEPEKKEYEGYIRELQEEGMLAEAIEYLQLEELQGVSGLKAMRVGVSEAVR